LIEAAISAVALNGGVSVIWIRVNCMLLCPPHSTTSPNSTSCSANVSPLLQWNAKVSPLLPVLAAVGGSACRHSPAAVAATVKFTPRKVVVTTVPGTAKPKSVVTWSRCNTM
jgi:hypothetical protein